MRLPRDRSDRANEHTGYLGNRMRSSGVNWSFVPVERCEVCGERLRTRLGIRSDVRLSQTLRLPREAPVTTVFRCARCRLVYCDPRPQGRSVEEVYGDVEDYFTIPIDQERLSHYSELAERLASYRSGTKGACWTLAAAGANSSSPPVGRVGTRTASIPTGISSSSLDAGSV